MNGTTPDPRPDADLEAALLDALRRRAGHSLEFRTRPVRLTGGFWADLVAFEVADAPEGWEGRLVARVMPDARTAAKETALQTAVARLGYPTPTVRAAGTPLDGVGGRAFMVMDHAPGRPLLAGLDGVAAIAKLPSLARTLPDVLGKVLADLHRLDPKSVLIGLEEAGVAAPSIAVLLEELGSTARLLGRADLVAASDWLTDHPPADGPSVVCHGDLHPFNVLSDDSGRVTVLDWSVGVVAPAAYDLAFTSLVLSEPPLLVRRPLGPFVRFAGRGLARRFLRRYRAHGGAVDEQALVWHQGVVCLRALTEVAGWVGAGTVDGRSGHPWIIAGDAFADRLSLLSGVTVSAR